MSTCTAKGEKRKSQEYVSDISTSHHFVAPHEICPNSLGGLQFLVSGYLFDDRSFTSLCHQSEQIGWDRIFINERERLKANENSVVKCFILNGLLHRYKQDPKKFRQQVQDLHTEIKLRMVHTFPDWLSQDLYREIQGWRDIQRRRYLFYFNYKEEKQMPDLPSFLMLQKAMTNWCEYMINYCRQNKNYWNHGGRDDFIKMFEHSVIIVAQPTGPDGVPVTHYTKNNFSPSAKLNVRIICLLDPDVLQNHIELSNIGVTLCLLNQNVNNIELEQAPIVWQIQKVMSADNGPISIYYTEVRNLLVNNNFSKRKTVSSDSNLCQLKFRTTIKLKFDLTHTTNSLFKHDVELTSQSFGIASHSQYSPDIVAKVVYHEVEQILKDKEEQMNPDILTEYTCRYQKRTLGVETKEHTERYVKQVFVKVFEDAKDKNTRITLKSLIEKRLAQLISQIKYFVDYPILTMMYDDSLFLGICNNAEVDGMLVGTAGQPHMLSRFDDLLRHQWQESPEIRCIIHNGTPEKTTFSKKAFIDDMCRFIYESANDTAKQTAVFSYSDKRVFHDFQRYHSQAIFVRSKITPPEMCSYRPLIPVLWQMRSRSQNHVNGNSQSQSNSLPTGSCHSSNSTLTNDPLTITYTVNQQDLQNNLTAITFDIKMPGAVNIDPDVIVHYLREKFRDLCKIQNENMSDTDSIQPLQTTTCSLDIIDGNIDEEVYTPINEFDEDQNRSLRTPILETDFET